MDHRDAITGLVLAGGRGTRMGGLDKGLQLLRSVPLARHAALRLAPQVGRVAINANRHLEVYEAWGWPVWPDEEPGSFHGPLAGMLAGLTHSPTDWLVTVPCDVPDFPGDLVTALMQAVSSGRSQVAYAACAAPGDVRGRGTRAQPTFCVMHRSLAMTLHAYIANGGRKVMDWLASQEAAEVPFGAPEAFFNANTLDDLARRDAGS